MMTALSDVRHSLLFRAALIVPSAIVLVFSLFNLSAAPDPARIAGAIEIGFVKLDTGMTFPPIKVSDRLQQGLSGQLPFSIREFEDEATARTALEAQEIAAFVLFPPEFSSQVFGDEPVDFKVVGAGNLTVAESRLAEQMPMMLQSGIAAAVSSLRLALAKGQMPTGQLPVNMSAEMVHPTANAAAAMAPFAASYTIWLSSMVGAVLLYLASRAVEAGQGRALLRTVFPVAATGAASLCLTFVVASTAGIDVGFLQFWLLVWALGLALAWFLGGLIAVFGLPVLVLVVPLVFYQAVLGGTQMPAAAAPQWLGWVSALAPFDDIGAMMRSLIIGGTVAPNWAWLGLIGVAGMAMIWAGTMIWARRS